MCLRVNGWTEINKMWPIKTLLLSARRLLDELEYIVNRVVLLILAVVLLASLYSGEEEEEQE